jgi:predicted hydrocarbon binding protein
MVPTWQMATSKRVGFAKNGSFAPGGWAGKKNRIRDLLRFRYPRKFDFCRMTLDEMKVMLDRVIREDKQQPQVYRPLVAIGHTKDLTDPETVEEFLRYLNEQQIGVGTFESIYSKLRHEVEPSSFARKQA